MRISNPVGVKGEDEATKFPKKKGYKILERNYRKRYTEIDIVAIDKQTLIFIEVKTRTSSQFGTPLEAITYFKLNSLIKASQEYAISHPKLPKALRIDAISVILDKNEQLISLEHMENISGF